MNSYSILNTIILVLSLSTLILTMATFFVFKIRQVKNAFLSNNQKKESAFFIIYEPIKTKQDIEAEKKEAQQAPVKKKLAFNLSLIFVSTSLMIGISLVIADYFRPDSEIEKRKLLAKKHKALKDQGLLQSSVFKNGTANPKFEEVLPNPLLESYFQKAEALKKLKVVLFTYPQPTSFSAKSHSGSLTQWKTWLRHEGAQVKVVSLKTQLNSNPNLKNSDVVIFPDTHHIPNNIQNELIRYPWLKKGVIISGGLSTLDKKGEDIEDSILLKFLELNSTRRSSSASNPLIFKSGSLTNSSVPAGWITDWQRPELEFALRPQKRASHHELTYSLKSSLIKQKPSDLNLDSLEAFTWNKNSIKGVWMSFSPLVSMHEPTQFYANDFIISQLLWVSKKPWAQMASWPKNYSSALTVSLDLVKSHQSFVELDAIIRKNKVKPTYFFSRKMTQQKELGIDEPFEVAAYQGFKGPFEKETLEQQFDILQQLALHIEQWSEKKVRGLHPPGGKLSLRTLNALFQRPHWKYLYSKSKHPRLEPLFINQKQFVHFPQVLRDDSSLYHDYSLGGIEELTEALLDQSQLSQIFGGAYYANFNTEIFGRTEYIKVVSEYLSKFDRNGVWISTFAEQAQWWKAKNKLEIKLQKTNADQWMLKVTNKGKQRIKALSLNLVGLDIAKISTTKRDPATEAPRLNKGPFGYKLYLPQIKPDETLSLLVEGGNDK